MKKKGFTLIELLIVVAIIAILAAIAVPNFLEAQVRSKVSRGRTDVRSCATALEAYGVDYNSYPPMADVNSGHVWGAYDATFHSRMPSFLTTPKAYITSLPLDPFLDYNPGFPIAGFRYVYYNMREHLAASPSSTRWKALKRYEGDWCMYGVGPDKDAWNTYGYVATMVYINYDPTNGTVSTGNVWRTQAHTTGLLKERDDMLAP